MTWNPNDQMTLVFVGVWAVLEGCFAQEYRTKMDKEVPGTLFWDLIFFLT